MILIRLREALQAHERRTGQSVSYEELARQTGLSRATIESIASRPGYNATLESIEKLCRTLDVGVDVLLELHPGGGEEH